VKQIIGEVRQSMEAPTARRRRRAAGALALGLSLLIAAAAAVAQEMDAAATALPQVPDNYTIGKSDVLQIEVFGLDDLDIKSRVALDGTISLPLLGIVPVEGLTTEQAERKIATLLSDGELIHDPQVSIFVEEFVSRGISVQGAVKVPGVYQMMGTQTVLDMLGQAGGIIGDEAGTRIFVIRKGDDGSQETMTLDTERLVELGDTTQNVALRPGDIVMVPHERRVRVYVSGAVESPGPIEFSASEGISLLQAVTAAGGPTTRANLSSVTVLRTLPDGTQSKITVDLKKIRKGKAEDFVLQPNDTVVLEDWFF
jgi:polysaccharide export outer membrane protein